MSGADPGTRAPGWCDPWLLLLLALGAALRVAYVLAQPAADPTFHHPQFDGAYYTDWATAIAAGGDGPPGAFYLAPLYPHVLSVVRRVLGAGSQGWLLLQHAGCVVAAAFVGLHARGFTTPLGSRAAAAAVLFYPPLLFFASRPLGEWLAILLCCAALLCTRGRSAAFAAAAGLLAGLGALARPNLLAVPAAWAAIEALRGRWHRVALLVAGVAAALAPVAWHNYVASGHLVLVSSNGGLTAYHGNGPGASGIYTQPAGLSGDVATQRDEATRLASRLAGVELDPVEADAWWGRAALRARLDDPVGTLALLLRRVALTLDNREHGLDYDPRLDRNPWRPTIRVAGHEAACVPFALLAGLAAAGLAGRGVRGSGGTRTWAAIVACAATPILFYVSSRYRLPAAVLLSLPAGAGVSVLFERGATPTSGQRVLGAGAGILVALLSVAVPSGPLERAGRAIALANHASAYHRVGDLGRAEQDARRAAELAPTQARPALVLGRILEARDLEEEAERAYRAALGAEPPGRVEAAGRLAHLLLRAGRLAEAASIARRGLAERPDDVNCWNSLVAALIEGRDAAAARRAAEEARRRGVRLDPGVAAAVPPADRGAP